MNFHEAGCGEAGCGAEGFVCCCCDAEAGCAAAGCAAAGCAAEGCAAEGCVGGLYSGAVVGFVARCAVG